MVNPINGECIRFLKGAADTNGQTVQFESRMNPGGVVGPEHTHRIQESRFEVVTGTANFSVNGRRFMLQAGDTLTVPPRSPHYFWNDGPEELHMIIAFSPALRTEEFFRTYFTLARAGKTDLKGVRNIFQRAVLHSAYFDESHPVRPSTPTQILLMILAPVGRLLGYPAVVIANGDPVRQDPEIPSRAA